METTVRLFLALFRTRSWNIKPTTDVDVGDCIYSEDMLEKVKLAYTNGFQIGSHTWSHPHLPSLKVSRLVTFFFSFAFVRW